MSVEQALLDALNASLQAQDVYEDRVIREATQTLAPSLTGLGLPPLHALAPGYDPRQPDRFQAADEPPIYAVLERTRRELQELERRTSTETSASSVADVDSQLDRLYLKEQLILSLLTTVAGKSADELPARPESRRRWEASRRAPDRPPPDVARPNPAASSPSPLGLRCRVPMMEHRRRAAREALAEEGVEQVTLEERERLERVRLERKRKRQMRLAAEETRSSSSSDSSTEEEEFQGSEEDDKIDAADVNDPSEEEGATAVCPLCQTTVSSVDASQIDSILSRHIDMCQQRRSTRRSRGSDNACYSSRDIQETTGMLDQLAATKRSKRNGRKTKSCPRPSRKKRTLQFTRKKRTLQLTSSKLDVIDDMEEVNYEDRVDDWIENGLGRMRKMSERDEADELPGDQILDGLYVPAWVNDRLFGYQREGIKWMWGLHQQRVGGVVGDEMGLGKTVQVCSFLGILAAYRKLKSVLIIAPATMLQHWLNELAIWAPGLRRILVHQSGESDGVSRGISSQMLKSLDKWLQQCRSDRLYEAIDEQDYESMRPHSFCGTGYVVITTYENLRRNPAIYQSHDFSYLVLDEAQQIRNPDADITTACKQVTTPHRLALSGCPIQNDLRELWSIFDFVFPGRLGMLQTFEQEFADPIRRGGYSNASPVQVQLAYRCSLVLRDLIKPYLLRRQKKDIKEVQRMPGKTEHVLFCRLSSQQRAMYKAFLGSDEVRRVLRGNNQLFAAVTVLRKICNHPDLVCSPDSTSVASFIQNGFVDESRIDSDEDDELDFLADKLESDSNLIERCGKLEVLSKILPLWHKQGHRVLIFCQWVKVLNIIQKFTMAQGWRFGRIDGKTSVAARQRLVDAFNSDTSYFGLLCTTQTGGVGLNLTGANRIILYDPAWNPQTDSQARERAWRFGQQKEVTVYRLITAGTIEEKIYHRQIFKTSLSNKVLQDPRQRRLFSQRDLRDLFTLKDDTGSVRAGSDGITETAAFTNGAGVIDPDEEMSEEALKDDQETLKHVMKSKGLAGVFDHNFVEQDCRQKSTTVREIEEQAKRVARDAAKALERSTEASKFAALYESRFGTSTSQSIGAIGSGKGSGPSDASSSLLASLRQRNTTLATGGDGSVESSEVQKSSQLLSRLRNFIRGRSPNTDAIMAAFADDMTSSREIAVFRGLLTTVAVLDKGKWFLKDS